MASPPTATRESRDALTIAIAGSAEPAPAFGACAFFGGGFFDHYGSCGQIRHLAIGFGLLSAIAHLLVQERAAPRIGLAHGE